MQPRARMQAQLRDTHNESEVPDEPDSKLVGLAQSDVVIRKVALAYILQRLTEGDLASAKAVLLAVGQVRRVGLLQLSVRPHAKLSSPSTGPERCCDHGRRHVPLSVASINRS
jgi:hypothetical protein